MIGGCGGVQFVENKNYDKSNVKCVKGISRMPTLKHANDECGCIEERWLIIVSEKG